MTEHSSLEPSTIRALHSAAAGLVLLSLLLVASTFLPSTEAAATSLTGSTAHDVVTLTVDRPRTGHTEVEVRLSPLAPGSQAPSADPAVVTLQAVLPTAGHAGPETVALPTGNNRYRTEPVHLMAPGRWIFLVSVDRGATRDQYEFPLTLAG
ncbi:hypothetical protein ACFU7X_00980 [Streptomyces chartreusis]|uniref:hypothetical protein n=1 Tax=Streptomyces chartreusis TaxID=1969 RepID=UPI0036CB95BF